MNENLEIIKENSILEGVEIGDIASTDEIVSRIIEQKYTDSLAYQVCDVQPLHGPTGGAIAVKYAGGKAIVVRNNVSVIETPLVNTGFTLEAIEDMQTQYGKNAIGFISKVFGGISNQDENTKLLAFMDTIAENKTPLILSDSQNAETNFFETAQKISESIIEINSITYRSMDAFVILPLKSAAAVMGLGVYFNDTSDTEAGLFLGKIRRTKYYINPDPASNVAYVGVNSKMPGTSSIIFSPYQHQLLTAVDPLSGQTNVFNVNRYAITENALSEVGNKMLHKFTIAP